MNLEEFREYCLSLGEVEEKLPFAKMPGGESVLVFYVSGHTFCYCDLNDLRVVVKCQPERIPELLDTAEGVTPPDSHFSVKYWIHPRRTAQRAGRRIVRDSEGEVCEEEGEESTIRKKNSLFCEHSKILLFLQS